MVTKVLNWINYRLPIINTFERHLSKHPVPKKVNFWYLFGALASIVLILQIVTGIWLMMPYSNTEEGAFASIEYIMRDVDYGWIIRYMHTYRSIDVLCYSLSSYVQRPPVWFI
jgi:ubiquinol-cytochrome c reductase cytochrome b subunit